MRRGFFFVFLITTIFLPESFALPQEVSLLGKKAPSLVLKDLRGKTFESSKIFEKNKMTVLNFWATWCTSCLTEFPEMEKLHREMATEKASVVAVNVEETGTDIKKALKDLKVSFPILLETKGESKASYFLVALPATFLVDSKGVIRAEIRGGTTAAIVREKINSLILKKSF